MIRKLSIITIVFMVFSVSAVADNLSKDKKRLENLQLELKQKKDALEKQKKDVKAMEKKLECKYNLLQSYNKCEENNKKDSKEYLKCMEKAKSENGACQDNA